MNNFDSHVSSCFRGFPISSGNLVLMQKLQTCLFAALLPTQALAGNFATCLLDKLPSLQNDIAAQAVYQHCEGMYPTGLPAVKQGSGRGLFSFNSGAECTAKKAGETRSVRAAALIGVACRRLYDEPNPFDLFDLHGIKP